jgi:hypothetical protein
MCQWQNNTENRLSQEFDPLKQRLFDGAHYASEPVQSLDKVLLGTPVKYWLWARYGGGGRQHQDGSYLLQVPVARYAVKLAKSNMASIGLYHIMRRQYCYLRRYPENVQMHPNKILEVMEALFKPMCKARFEARLPSMKLRGAKKRAVLARSKLKGAV